MSLTKRQLALRRDAIGGSEVGALAGLSKWASPIQIFEAKVLGEQKEESLAMFLGTELEEPIAKLYARETKRWVRPCDSIINPKYPLALATPDRAVFERPVPELARKKLLGLEAVRQAEKGLEVKSTTWRQAERWGPEGSDEIPEEYLAQVQWCMGVTGLTTWDCAVLIDKDDFRTYSINFDEELFLGLYEIAARFMRDHVIPKRPPPVDATEQYSEFLGRRWRNNEKERIASTPEIEQLATFLAHLAEHERRLKHWKGLTKNRLMELIGQAGGVDGAFGKISWNRNKDSHTVDWKAMATDARDVAALLIQALPPGDQRTQLTTWVTMLETSHTKVGPGARPFKFTPSKPLLAELQARAQLPALSPITVQNNPQDNQDHQ